MPRCEPSNDDTATPGPIEALADEAVDWIAKQIQARDADLSSLPGARGRLPTRQDLRHHVEFLGAAVGVAAPVYFIDYVLWLARVLEARGAPVQTLAESLRLLRRFLEQRLEPEALATACRYLDAALAALTARATGAEAATPRDRARMPEPFAAAGALARHLVAGDTAAARAVVAESHAEGHGYVAIATHLFQPALYEIGRAWERNEITVAEEHLAAAIVQTLLVELFLKGPFQPPHGRRVLLAGIEHNHHVIGLRILADAYELAGWTAQYLGADTPTPALLAQVDRSRPDVVGLSASLVRQLPTLGRSIAALRAEFGGRCPVILVGGIPTNQFEGVWRHLGADGWGPDAEAALRQTP